MKIKTIALLAATSLVGLGAHAATIEGETTSASRHLSAHERTIQLPAGKGLLPNSRSEILRSRPAIYERGAPILRPAGSFKPDLAAPLPVRHPKGAVSA